MVRIALIHAVAVAMDPTAEAFERLWPDATLQNILDDSLSRDRASAGGLTPDMTARFVSLARYAAEVGADGVLFTCSAFGPCIEAAAGAVPIPVLKPNEAMFGEAVRRGGRIGLLASFAPSLPPMVEEYHQMAPGHDLATACVPEAMDALAAGDGPRHDALLADGARALGDCGTIMLAQFSTARAREAVAAATGRTVLTSPDSAVLAMKAALA
ncbi:MAG: aspartate/glutamate racemase family protein [Pseudomonadota bacterium]